MEESAPFAPTTLHGQDAAFGPSCWLIWRADVYLPVCACCTGWRIFCTASVDRQTHCNSFSQLVLLLRCCLFTGPCLVSRHGTVARETHRVEFVFVQKDKLIETIVFSPASMCFHFNVGQLNLWPICCVQAFSLCRRVDRHDGAVYCMNYVCEESRFYHSLVLSIHLCVCASLLLSPPLSTGSLGIHFFVANLEQSQSRPNVHSQTPKIYETHTQPSDSTWAAQHWVYRLSFDTLVW